MIQAGILAMYQLKIYALLFGSLETDYWTLLSRLAGSHPIVLAKRVFLDQTKFVFMKN